MTNAQIYLSTAIQSTLIMVTYVLISFAWVHENKRLTRIEAALEASRRDLRAEFTALRMEANKQRVKD